MLGLGGSASRWYSGVSKYVTYTSIQYSTYQAAIYTDIPTSWAIITAVMRLGGVAFLISARNSASAVADMLTRSETRLLVVEDRGSLRQLADDAVKLVQNDSVKLLQCPEFRALYGKDAHDFEPLPKCKVGMDDTAIILHSSGITLYATSICAVTDILVKQQALPHFPSWSIHHIGLCGVSPYITVRMVFDMSGIDSHYLNS